VLKFSPLQQEVTGSIKLVSVEAELPMTVSNQHGGGGTRPLPRDGGVEELHGDPSACVVCVFEGP